MCGASAVTARWVQVARRPRGQGPGVGVGAGWQMRAQWPLFSLTSWLRRGDACVSGERLQELRVRAWIPRLCGHVFGWAESWAKSSEGVQPRVAWFGRFFGPPHMCAVCKAPRRAPEVTSGCLSPARTPHCAQRFWGAGCPLAARSPRVPRADREYRPRPRSNPPTWQESLLFFFF